MLNVNSLFFIRCMRQQSRNSSIVTKICQHFIGVSIMQDWCFFAALLHLYFHVFGIVPTPECVRSSIGTCCKIGICVADYLVFTTYFDRFCPLHCLEWVNVFSLNKLAVYTSLWRNYNASVQSACVANYELKVPSSRSRNTLVSTPSKRRADRRTETRLFVRPSVRSFVS